MLVPPDIVAREYIPNIYNNERVISGTELEDGMVVLLEDSLQRAIPTIDRDARRALENNRWCKVTDLHYSDLYESGTLVTFTGEYSNGDIIQRRYNASYAWIVKTDSVPEDMQPGVSFLAFARRIPVRDRETERYRDPWAYLDDDEDGPRDAGEEEDLPTETGNYLLTATVPAEVAEGLGWTNPPIIGEIDPELERLIAEEEEIEARFAAERASQVTEQLQGVAEGLQMTSPGPTVLLEAECNSDGQQ